MVEDPMGLETNIYQQVQKSTDLITQESHFQLGQIQSLRDEGVTIEEQDNLKVQPLSILQTPTTIVPNAKTLSREVDRRAPKLKQKLQQVFKQHWIIVLLSPKDQQGEQGVLLVHNESKLMEC